MTSKNIYIISGKKEGIRVSSRVLEERLQEAVNNGERHIRVDAFGQHGIGGRLWKAGEEAVKITIAGSSGQRVGAMGFPNTFIEIMGPASDDAGWLNAGARIVIHGHAGNGLANAMAQGKIYVAGNIGARGMTMTKSNPRFEPPELWVLGSAGDYFGEFMAGGIAVVCGIDAQTPDNILGYRPLVGMVGGQVFFRGEYKGFSTADAKLVPITDANWHWLQENTKVYLNSINRSELLTQLSVRNEWQLLTIRSSREKEGDTQLSITSFRTDIWDKELGTGGMIGDLVTIDRSPVPLITTNELRRYRPVWENKMYLAPCQASCPTGIPVQERWRLIRDGRVDEAIDLALAYTPFPASVCGYLCPNLCMEGCTRNKSQMKPIDLSILGKSSIKAKTPETPEQSGKKIAIVGGGPAGISAGWQLNLNGHSAVIYDTEKIPGGKISSVIPENRMPKDVLAAELKRIRQVVPQIHLQKRLGKKEIEQLKNDFDYLILAAGTWKPRNIPVPGNERLIMALDFLSAAKTGSIQPGRKVVIIGAGNVGCDVATEAYRLGAREVTLIDVQEPASFGKEREEAEASGAVFRWPCFTREITKKGVVLQSGEILQADTAVISIGDAPDTDFLPDGIETDRGFVKVSAIYQTSDPKIFAIGDMVKPGLLTDAIGAGRKTADAINALLTGKISEIKAKSVIDMSRISLEYFDSRLTRLIDIDQCGAECSSCGTCRDCGICIAICPQAAISRKEVNTDTGFAYIVDETICIGCGFCAGACPCGIWNLIENEPIKT